MRSFLLALCALLAAPALAQTQPTGQLPDTARPIAYRLDFTILPDQPRFSGHAEIDVELKAATRTIYMHGRDLKIAKAVARVGRRETPVTFTQKTPQGLALLDFGREVPAGRVTLKFDYDAAFGDGPAGLYRIKVENDWYSWTQFESIDARAAFPSFDQPGYKTPFTVSITTKPGLAAISNAPETGRGTPVGKLVKHRFIPTEPLPTYLVALVTGPFAIAQTVVPPSPQRKTPLPLRVVGTKPNATQLQYALAESGKIVTLLEKYFDQPFPYPKLDQIGSPVMPGAMENAGADIYGDFILFLDEKSDIESKQLFGMVVAHELSHQWFGDLVTPAWWDDIWLNESFANWMGYRIGNEWRRDLNIGVDALREGFEAMEIDALKAGRPIHQTITRDADIDAAFDQITYGKGGHVVGMVAAYLGEEKFRDGVRLHMKRYHHGNASTDQFFGSLAEGAHDPKVLEALRSFVDQQGVPVVNLSWRGDTLQLRQQPYAYFGTNAADARWTIPVCVNQVVLPVVSERGCTLLDKAEGSIAGKAGLPTIPNVGGWGYYRFDMDADGWKRLIDMPHYTEGETMAATDSLWASFYAGQPRMPELIAWAKATANDSRGFSAVDNGRRLQGLHRRGLISDAALPAYRRLFDGIYGPMLAKLGFDPAEGAHAGDDAARQKLRSDLVELVATAGRDSAVRQKLVAAADGYLAGTAKTLDPQYMELALTVAVDERGVPFAKTLADKALAGQDALLRQNGFNAIGGSGNADVARWFLNDFKDARLTMTSRLYTVSALLGSAATRDIASDFMLSNFEAFSKASGGGGIFSSQSARMFDVLCSTAQADAVEAKLRPQLKDLSTLGLDRAVETIRNCARFRDAKAAEVSAAVMAQ